MSKQVRVAVYTPMLRVALAAHHANHRGHRFVLTEAPDWLTSPLVYFVFRWPCPDLACEHIKKDRGVTYDPRVVPRAVLVPRADHPRSLNRRDAEFVTTDLSALALLGGPPFEHAVALAAFRPEHVRAGLVAYAYWEVDRDFIPSEGFITEEIIAAWR